MVYRSREGAVEHFKYGQECNQPDANSNHPFILSHQWKYKLPLLILNYIRHQLRYIYIFSPIVRGREYVYLIIYYEWFNYIYFM